jgi:hypothetical protein
MIKNVKCIKSNSQIYVGKNHKLSSIELEILTLAWELTIKIVSFKLNSWPLRAFEKVKDLKSTWEKYFKEIFKKEPKSRIMINAESNEQYP